MKKIRVCHMADFHLGGELNVQNSLKEEINNNLIKTLFEIFRMLEQSKVDIVLIAGDFYETSSVDFRLLKQIKEILGKFSGKIFISPGNHDYVSLESVYRDEWPSNVHIFLNEEMEMVEIEELNTRVYGFGFNHSHIYERKIRDIKVNNQFINLGVFHGQIASEMNAYHPIFKEDIANSGLEYIALGHVHKRTAIQKLGKTYYSYSGNPLGRGFDETGEKGIYLGDITKNSNNMHFYKVSDSQFQIENIEIENFETQADIANEIREKLEVKFGKLYKRHFYRINLFGYRNENEFVNVDILMSYLEDIKYIEIYDLTKIQVNLEKLSKENTLKGIFAKELLKSDISTENREKIMNLALELFED